MTKFIRDKRIITQKVLEELPFEKDNNELEVSLFRWWKNIREDGGLRLTAEGDNAFRLAGLESWDIRCEDYESRLLVNTAAGALNLDQFMPCPYYMFYDKTDKCYVVKVYDSRVVVLIQLHGSLSRYLNSIKSADK